jgi:tRNA (cmo5U34)-methyltransferase
MRDNTTSQPAREYDANIYKTLPFYDYFHDSSLSLIQTVNPRPAAWLDTGCGTGTLVQTAAGLFPDTAFTLADPSAAMLELAAEKMAGVADCTYLAAGTEALACPSAGFDVITAIMAHHYFDRETRRQATANCFRMLRVGGIYITFEHIMPFSEQGRQIGLERWRRTQIRQGKDAAAADKHIKRFGVEYFPITVDDHLALLRETGFKAVELLWAAGMQTGFYAIK